MKEKDKCDRLNVSYYLKKSSLIICPKFTWNVLVGGLTEWYSNASNMCFGPGRLAFPSLLEHTKHCFA